MEGNTIIPFENLCRIFEMRIKLDKEKGVKSSLDVLNNYEKYSKKIDSFYNSEFQKQLKALISPAVTLEKEKDRLRRLIKLLEDRLDKRIELEDNFYNVTGKNITGLQMIVSDSELEEKKERLSLISNYLDTSKEIEDVTDSLNKLETSLIEEEEKREEYKEKHKIMEDELYSAFIKIIRNDENYKDITDEDINSELEEIRSKVSETKETLDITKESIGSLMNSGLEDDYASYIEEAEKSYFNYKNKELTLKLYKLVIRFEDDFKLISSKREKINEILEEKKTIRDSLSIETENELLDFENTLVLQIKTLDNEREVLENITNYTSRINFKEERLEELKEMNNSSDILVILREYGLVDTYEMEDIEEEIKEEELEETLNIELPQIDIPSLEETISEIVYDPYRIVEVKDYPKTLNVGLAKLKGESVREKVNKKLNPKIKTENIDTSNLEENKLPDLLNGELTKENLVSNLDDNTVSEEMLESSTNNKETPEIENIEMPVWTIPTEIENEIVNQDIQNNVELPVWETIVPLVDTQEQNQDIQDSQNSVELPVWETIKPTYNIEETKKEEISNIDILSSPADNNNIFWQSVSDSKLETKEFPNINIPVSSNFNESNNFDFPTINN